MEPITILTYIVISHYSYSVVNNFYDYCKFMYNFHVIRNEISYINEKLERIITLEEEIENKVKKLKHNLVSKE
jgi:hypothetical protein